MVEMLNRRPVLNRGKAKNLASVELNMSFNVSNYELRKTKSSPGLRDGETNNRDD